MISLLRPEKGLIIPCKLCEKTELFAQKIASESQIIYVTGILVEMPNGLWGAEMLVKKIDFFTRFAKD